MVLSYELDILGKPEKKKGIASSDLMLRWVELAKECDQDNRFAEGQITSLDGTDLKLIVGGNSYLRIEEDNFSFTAQINWGIVSFAIYNEIDAKKSNHIFPLLLMIFVLDFWGINAKKIQTIWNRSGGTNTTMYREGLRLGFSKVEAAKQTWSGKRLGQIGFSEVEVNDSDRLWIYAYFSIPD